LAHPLLLRETEIESHLTPQRKWRGYPLVNLPVHPGRAPKALSSSLYGDNKKFFVCGF